MISGMLTIVIVTWNCKDHVSACIESLSNLGNLPFKFETIVVDNGSEDGTVEYLKSLESQFPDLGLTLIYNPKNVGLSRATEQAYHCAKGDWILLCNPDIIFGRDFGEFLSFGVLNEDCIIGTEMLNSDGSPQRVVHRRFPTVSRVFFGFGFVGGFLDRKIMHRVVENRYTYQNENFPRVVAIEQPGASFLLVSRKVIQTLGFIFDTQFPIWWNDVDLAQRAEKNGIKRIVISTIKVRHGQARGGARQMDDFSRRYLFTRSMLRYAKKWNMHPQLLRFLFCVDAMLGIPLSTLVLQRRTGNFSLATRESLRQAVGQISGITSV